MLRALVPPLVVLFDSTWSHRTTKYQLASTLPGRPLRGQTHLLNVSALLLVATLQMKAAHAAAVARALACAGRHSSRVPNHYCLAIVPVNSQEILNTIKRHDRRYFVKPLDYDFAACENYSLGDNTSPGISIYISVSFNMN